MRRPLLFFVLATLVLLVATACSEATGPAMPKVPPCRPDPVTHLGCRHPEAPPKTP